MTGNHNDIWIGAIAGSLVVIEVALLLIAHRLLFIARALNVLAGVK